MGYSEFLVVMGNVKLVLSVIVDNVMNICEQNCLCIYIFLKIDGIAKNVLSSAPCRVIVMSK